MVPEHPAPDRTQLTPALGLLFCTSFCTNALNPTDPPIEIVGAVGMTLTEIGVTVNCNPLLAIPDTVTTTLPVVDPTGTGTTTVLAFQLIGLATVPLKVTVLLPWLAPKFAPDIVTIVLGDPEPGLRLVMFGGGGVADPASAANIPSAGAAVLQVSSVE